MNKKTLTKLAKLTDKWLKSKEVKEIESIIKNSNKKSISKKLIDIGGRRLKRHDRSFFPDIPSQNINYGGSANVYDVNGCIVKYNVELCSFHKPLQSCPTIFITSKDGTEFLIQPRLDIEIGRCEKIQKKMEDSCIDGHIYNWGYWHDIPLLYDW